MNRKLMKQTVTISNKHLQEIFYRHNLPGTAETSVTNETGLKNWTSSTETTETMKMNRKLMKQTVTSNKHLLGKFKKKCDQSVTLGFKNKHYVRAFFFVT